MAKKSNTDIAADTKRLDAQVAKCRVGVAWIDLLTIPNALTFGTFNDRVLEDAEVNKMIASFKASGIVSMKDVSAIPIILDVRRLVDAKGLVKDFSEVDEVKELALKDKNAIIVASGQHRYAAVRRYYESLREELSGLEKQLEKIAGLKNLTEDHVRTHQELRESIALLKGQMDGMGEWGVIVYDQCM